MLVLSRKVGETIIFGDNVRITVLGFRGTQVRIGIEAPPEVPVFREELVSPGFGAAKPSFQRSSPAR